MSYQRSETIRKEIKLYDLRISLLLLWALCTATQVFFYKGLEEPHSCSSCGSCHSPPSRAELPGMFAGAASLFSSAILRELIPNVVNERQKNQFMWTLVLSPKLGQDCKPSLQLGSERDALLFLATISRILPPLLLVAQGSVEKERSVCSSLLPLNHSAWGLKYHNVASWTSHRLF